MRRILLVLTLAVIALPFAARAQEGPPGGDRLYELCANRCYGGSVPCTTQCRQYASVWTTCGVYWGNPANDLDSDGVPNASDNCTCTANSNQANCDGDGQGDACDGFDNSWTLIQVGVDTCHMDVDDHFGYETMEIYFADTYQSSCTGATCKKKKLVHDFNCYPDVTLSCCNNNWNWVDCNGFPWSSDLCGTPRCNF